MKNESPPSFDDGRPPFDHTFAKRLIGKLVLVGMTIKDKSGAVKAERQFFGRVAEADPRRGICLCLEGSRKGETYWLPPDTRAFFPAKPGSYKLRSTGEVLSNPDFTTTWTMEQPDA